MKHFTILFMEPSQTIETHLSIHTLKNIISIATYNNRNVLMLIATEFQFIISKSDSNPSERL